MKFYVIPFQNKVIIYRPLRQLAFIGNSAMARYLLACNADQHRRVGGAVDDFLESIAFWTPDPPTPETRRPSVPHRPTDAVLLMTNACNLRCTYCYANSGETARQDLQFDIARTVIDFCRENARQQARNSYSVTFHGGGEPTLPWELLTALVAYIESTNFPCKISIATNGVLSNEQRSYILQHFADVSLSFDGIRAVQDRYRPGLNGGSSFDHVMETIRTFDENKFPYGIRMTTTPDAFSHLPESVDFICRNTLCRTMQVEPCYTTGRGQHSDPDQTQADIFSHAFLEAFEIAAEAKRALFYSGAQLLHMGTEFCRAALDSLIVTPEADLVTCYEIASRTHPLSHLFTIGHVTPDHVVIDDAALARNIDTQLTNRNACQSCHCFWHCAGDCASRSATANSHTRMRCHVNQTIIRELLLWYIAAGNGVWNGTHATSKSCTNC